MRPRDLHLLLATLILSGCEFGLTPPSSNGDGDPPDIDHVSISPGRHVMIVGDSVRLTAVAYTKECDFEYCSYPSVPAAAFTWRSSDRTVVTVSGGLVRAAGRGSARVFAEAGGVSASASIEVGTAYVLFARLGAGGRCALTGAGAAYCWTNDFSSANIPEVVPGALLFTSIATGSALTCAIAADAQGYCWGSGASPALIAGGLHFQSLSPGRRDVFDAEPHTCGVLRDSTAVCWGADDAGQLGTGLVLPNCHNIELNRDYRCSSTAVPVDSLTGLVAVSAGGRHSCALGANGTAYCWGDNVWGQLGDSSTVSRETPRAVRGAPPLAAIVAGIDHTCGITRSALLFCWGRNETGQLGIGSRDSRSHPVPALVAGSASTTSLDAASRTCALTQMGSVHCWGDVVTPVGGGIEFQSMGVLAPTFPRPFVPAPVGCGVAFTGRGYCWDWNGNMFALVRPILP